MLPSVFNCSNDMALAAGVSHYVPPKRIQQMESDLASLSRWWHDTCFAGPWGWSAATKRRYRLMGIDESLLPSDAWLAEVRRLSSREHACLYIERMLRDESLPLAHLVGEHMRFCRQADLQAMEQLAMEQLAEERPLSMEQAGEQSLRALQRPLIFKSPWSSSGRGVFVARGMDERALSRLRGFVSSQGGFAMDRFYERKLVDFAMEYYLDGEGTAIFLGYSVFSAGEGGAYGFNYVEPQSALIERIGVAPELLASLQAYHAAHLASLPYRGAVGIDMMKVLDADGKEKVHPCVEINLRMNMGVLALILWRKMGSSGFLADTVELTEPREHGFQAVVDHGKLMICFKR